MLLSMADDKEDKISESIKEEYPHKSTLLGDHGKLCIKLKINSFSDDDGGDEEQEEDFAKDQKQPLVSNNKTTRICQVCSKVFRSGKALGGHMRVHFQTHKDVTFSKKLIKSSQRSIIKLKKKRKREVAAADFAKRKDFLNTKKSSSSNDHDNGAAAAAGFINKSSPTTTCYICGKNFPSMKSLFGHMRCHPDREWRGIQPPPSAAVRKASPLSSVSDAEPQKTDDDYDDANQVDSAVADGDQTVDLTKSLGGWSVTAKRGRKAMVENSSSSEEDEGMRDAVYHLMSLAQGGDSSCEAKLATNKHKVEEFEATNGNVFICKTENEDIMAKRAARALKKGRKGEFLADHPVKELRNEERKVDGIHLDGMIRMGNNTKAAKETDFLAGKLANLDCQWEENTWPKDYYGDDDESEEDSENTGDDQLLINHRNFERANGNVSKKKRRKKMKLRDLESVHDDASPVHDQVNRVLTLTTSPEKYRCTTCNKCFPTHQALGGHRSSHNKFKMAIQNSFGESTTSPAGVNENLANESPVTPGMEESKESDEGAASSHQCKICDRNFSTGRGLGSHKRCQWPIGQVEGPSSQVTSSVSHTDRKVMEFDLNEVPPLEEDAGIVSDLAAGYGCATSSFNSVGFPGFGA